MSAVRMVAYGVLELHATPESQPWLKETGCSDKQKEENTQLIKLVRTELERYGLCLSSHVISNNKRSQRYRERTGMFTLYGQKQGKHGFEMREILNVGSLRDCCIAAAKALDWLDRSQVPDTAAGE